MATQNENKQNSSLRPTSFRGYPYILEPVRHYAIFKRRSLIGQIEIILENYLNTEEADKPFKSFVVTPSELTSEITPTPLMLKKSQKERIKEAVIASQMSMSLWINHALLYCYSKHLMEPQGSHLTIA